MDAVVTHGVWAHVIWGGVAAGLGIPYANFQHDISSGSNWLVRLAQKRPPTRVITNSWANARNIEALLFPQASIVVVYCPVEQLPSLAGAASEIRRRWRGEGRVVLLHSSRLQAGKGHKVLLEALVFLKDLPNWVCWVAGGAQRRSEFRYARELERSVAGLGLTGRVIFLGHVAEMGPLLAAADVYLHLNTSPEAFGVGIVEALFSKVPVVSAPIGGPVEILNEACGVLVTPEPHPVASVLRRLIQDPSERLRLAAQGPARASAISDAARQTRQLEDAILDGWR